MPGEHATSRSSHNPSGIHMCEPGNRVHEVFIYLRVHNAAAAIDFYCQAFGAQEVFRLTEPSGRIGHAELRIGPAVVMLSDEYPEHQLQGPRALGGTTFSIHLHVDDADQLMARAVAAGAAVVRALSDQFYGERSGTIRDPFGHEWLLGHEIEKVAPQEMQRRYTQMLK
jgi:PhnB protein